ncbi:dolichol phosphate-mannose biosynthesis regulatory protein-domain-containing protein [Spinellus fusiger]|nr:dolichol phosphate-mannose biosynthesis regulatory protein-domain-containing protein [Spinellus fusiger]
MSQSPENSPTWCVFSCLSIHTLFSSSHPMGTGTDKAVGAVAFFSSIIIFTYYTIWSLLMPFVDQGHPLRNYFLPWEYAIRIPLILLIIGLTVIFSFLGLVMVKSKSKQDKKAK